jgi:hypothetical protein
MVISSCSLVTTLPSSSTQLILRCKQENERCNAHSIDVWISSVSPALLKESWEGVVGETKDLSYTPTGQDPVMGDRGTTLKFSRGTRLMKSTLHLLPVARSAITTDLMRARSSLFLTIAVYSRAVHPYIIAIKT